MPNDSIYESGLTTPTTQPLRTSDITQSVYVPEVSQTDGSCNLFACNPPSDIGYQIPPDDTASIVYDDGVVGGDV